MRQLSLYLLLFLCAPAWAGVPERLQEANFAPQWSMAGKILTRKGQGVLDYLWVDVYAAALYASPTTNASEAIENNGDLRLELFYFHDIGRDDVIKAATATLKRQLAPAQMASLQPGLDALHSHFSDIHPGDRYALIRHAGAGIDLERNGAIVFKSTDPQLATAYLNLWLAPNGLSQSLRESLTH